MKLNINVEGKLYEVEVEVFEQEHVFPSYYPPLHASLPAAQPAPPAAARRGRTPRASRSNGAAGADESKVCRSPLAGTVARINAQVGQQIRTNDVLLVLEAMKMETVITAPFDGKVKAVNTAVGQAVTQGQVLVEIE